MRASWLLGYGLMMAFAATAGEMPPVGVVLDQGYFSVTERGGNDYDETFYPAGQNAQQWQERVQIARLDHEAVAPVETIEAALRRQAQQTCPGLSSLRVGEASQAIPVWMWHCPAAAPAATEVTVIKPVVSGAKVYLARVQFRGPAPEGRIPTVASAGLDRAMDFIAGFAACTRLTDRGCVPLPAVMGEHGEAAPAPEEAAELARVSQRGLAMHYQDQLAWHATDYVQQRRLFKPSREGGFMSVAGEGRGGSTYFVAEKRGRIDRVLRVDTGVDGVVTGSTALPALPEDLLPRWRARQAAVAHKDLKVCSPTANTLVLPAEDGDGWWVYVMSSSTQQDLVFLGGHNRLRVTADGRTVRSLEHSARSCLTADAAAIRALKSKEGAFFSHLVSPLPWETDVMQSLTHAFAVTRVTDSGIWRIEGDQIRKFALAPATKP